MTVPSPPRLLGRAGELEILGQLIANVRSGQSAVLVVRGEPGIGKTALLRHLIEQASGFKVIRGSGIESEMELARQTYLEALVAAIYAGRLARGQDVLDIARAAQAVPFGPAAAPGSPGAPGAEPPSHLPLLLRGLAVRLTDGYAAAAPMLTEALRRYRAQPQELDWMCVSYNMVAMDLWDDEAWFSLAADQVRLARANGTLSWLPFALDYLAEIHIQAGQLSAAAALLAEGERIDPGIRAATLPYVSLLLAAWRGDAQAAAELTESMVRGASARGEGAALTYAEYANAVLHNGLGNYSLAAEAANQASAAGELVISPWALYELGTPGYRPGYSRARPGDPKRIVRPEPTAPDLRPGSPPGGHASSRLPGR